MSGGCVFGFKVGNFENPVLIAIGRKYMVDVLMLRGMIGGVRNTGLLYIEKRAYHRFLAF